MRPARPLLLCLTVPLALALAACGEKRSASGTNTTKSTTAPTGAAVARVAVRETEYKLNPANPKVAKAGVVEFVARNDGKITHALEVEGPAGEVKSGNIAPGKSKTIKVDLGKPGRYEWYCPVDGHKKLGMKGEVAVAGGSGGSSTSKSSGGSSSGGRGGY